MGARHAFGRMKRISGSLALGAALLLGSAAPAAADTFPGPPFDSLGAGASWTENHMGVEYSWNVSANVDRLTGETSVSLDYFAQVDAHCPGGTIGSGDVFFNGWAEGDVQIQLDLGEASAAAVVRGKETTFLICGESFIERSRTRRFVVEFDLTATGAAQQTTEQVCDGATLVLFTAVSTFRAAEGTVTVNRKLVEGFDGGVSRQHSTDEPGTPCSLPE